MFRSVPPPSLSPPSTRDELHKSNLHPPPPRSLYAPEVQSKAHPQQPQKRHRNLSNIRELFKLTIISTPPLCTIRILVMNPFTADTLWTGIHSFFVCSLLYPFRNICSFVFNEFANYSVGCHVQQCVWLGFFVPGTAKVCYR